MISQVFCLSDLRSIGHQSKKEIWITNNSPVDKKTEIHPTRLPPSALDTPSTTVALKI